MAILHKVFSLILFGFCTALSTSSACADEQPDAKMMAAVGRVAQFIQTGGVSSPSHIFATSHVTIIENFWPHLFSGSHAVQSWSRQMRLHLVGVIALRYHFDRAYDFSRDGDQVFFSLPTTWQGLDHGKPFTEEGGWAFVLTKQHGDWRVRDYGWAVVKSSEE